VTVPLTMTQSGAVTTATGVLPIKRLAFKIGDGEWAAALSLLALGSQAQAASYAIDPAHTYVTFEIGHFGTSTNRGRFDKKEGKVA